MGSVLKISDTWYNLLHSECKRRKKSSSEAFLWAPGMSSGRDGPSVSREGRDSPATQRNKYNKIENDTSAAFVLVVGILKVFGKHTSGSYSSLIPFLKENKLKYKALSSLLSCLVQFPLPSVGVTPEQLEAGSCSPCNLTSPITSVRCHDMNLGVAVWIFSGVTMCNTYLGADKNMFSFCPSIFLTCVIFLIECWRECRVRIEWQGRDLSEEGLWGAVREVTLPWRSFCRKTSPGPCCSTTGSREATRRGEVFTSALTELEILLLLWWGCWYVQNLVSILCSHVSMFQWERRPGRDLTANICSQVTFHIHQVQGE